MQVLAVPARKSRQSYRRIDVVKGSHIPGRFEHPVAHCNTFRHIRADYYEISRRDCFGKPQRKIVQIVIEFRTAVWRARQVAVLRIPWNIALQKDDVMAASNQFPHQRPVGCSMTVPPRRSNGKPENRDLHRAAPTMPARSPCAAWARTSSTSFARWS